MNELDPLASLEIEEGLLPATLESALPELEIPTAALEHARAEIVSLKVQLAAEEARSKVLEEQLDKLGSDEPQARKLATEVAVLKAELAKRDALGTAEAETDYLLPAVVEARGQMALLQQQHAKESFMLSTALTASEARLGEAIVTAQELEYQRDERDDMLRREEATRQQAVRDKERVARQVALMRVAHLRREDPANDDKLFADVKRAKTRLLAALGNVGAQIELGKLEGQCALCDADPGCQRERLINWPHGTLIPRQIQTFLQILVDEAIERDASPFTALESWASGTSMKGLADPEPQCEAVDSEGRQCSKDSGRHTVHTPGDEAAAE